MLHASLLSNNAIAHGFFTRGEPLVLAEKPIVTLKQIHSNITHIITEPLAQPVEGDALVTKVKGLPIGILTADCAPVLLADISAGVIGAAHAGWRGAIGGIIDSVVAVMEREGAKRQHIVAAIGPCIVQASYEVGPEVFAQFMHDDYENGVFFKPSKKPDHHMFNVRAYVEKRLKQAGVARIEALPNDTYVDEENFCSFRRSTHRGEKGYGNQVSAIALL